RRKVGSRVRNELRHQLAQHCNVIDVSETRSGDENRYARLPERVLELAKAVRRIDVHEDRADLGRAVLRNHPLCWTRTPDTAAIAPFDAEREESARDPFDFFSESPEREAALLMAGDERLARAVCCRDSIEALADRFAEQRHA